jgi:hypothetical protein
MPFLPKVAEVAIGYGSVEITVYDARVVQIECRTKIRFLNRDSAES